VPEFAALQAAISEGKTADLVFFVFDQLFEGPEDLRDLPLATRKDRLAAHVDGAGPRLRYVDHFITAGDAVLLSACRMDLEGIVSKRLDAPYRSGRGETWTKSKCRAGHEVVIGGYTTTNGAFRSLIAGVHQGGKLIHVGRVGTGFGRDKVYINDPGSGPRVVDNERFDECFTGVVLTFEKTPEFSRGGERRSVARSLKRRLSGSYAEFLFLILCTLALVIPTITIPAFSRVYVDDVLVEHVLP